jgi:hypothetical protein
MSGTSSTSSAPNKLTPVSGDQPIGTDVNGQRVMMSPWFNQTITRILAYLGQPGGSTTSLGGATTNLTVSQQLSNLSSAVTSLAQGPGTASPGHDARIAGLERKSATLGFAVPPAPYGLTQPQLLARMWFGR